MQQQIWEIASGIDTQDNDKDIGMAELHFSVA